VRSAHELGKALDYHVDGLASPAFREPPNPGAGDSNPSLVNPLLEGQGIGEPGLGEPSHSSDAAGANPAREVETTGVPITAQRDAAVSNSHLPDENDSKSEAFRKLAGAESAQAARERLEFAEVIGSAQRVWIRPRDGTVHTDTGRYETVSTAALIRWLQDRGWQGGSGSAYQTIMMWKL